MLLQSFPSAPTALLRATLSSSTSAMDFSWAASAFLSRPSSGTLNLVSANNSVFFWISASTAMPPFPSLQSLAAIAWARSSEPAMRPVTWSSWYLPLRTSAIRPLRLSARKTSSTERFCTSFCGSMRPSSSRSCRRPPIAPVPTSQRSCNNFNFGIAMSMTTISILTQVSPRPYTPEIFSEILMNFCSELIFASCTIGQSSSASVINRCVRSNRFCTMFSLSSFTNRSGIMRKQLVCNTLPALRYFMTSRCIGECNLKAATGSFQKSARDKCGICTFWKRSRWQCDRKMNMATKRR
mmetsp:Transcript_83895/g.234167  ORF Transcript_83895/g.234167 Transcript_83895/m.234167 type:complete len:296 (+) Transcript_83895:423-1310(+)